MATERDKPFPSRQYDAWKCGDRELDLPSAEPGRFQCDDCGRRTNIDYAPCGSCAQPPPHPVYDGKPRRGRVRYWRIACQPCGVVVIVKQAVGERLPSGHCRACGSHDTRTGRAPAADVTTERRRAANMKEW